MKVEVVATLAVAPAYIWHAMVTPLQMSRWLCKEAVFEARVGKPYRILLAKPEGATKDEVLSGRVAAWVPEVRLSLSVTGAKHLTTETVVTLFLASLGEGKTRLTIVHDGFKKMANKDRPEAMAAVETFWKNAVIRLAALLNTTIVEGEPTTVAHV
ncbi:MAG: SRPBCC domain-containing protein [Candidatus Sericytochromatia bacterium]|nr:SRPBCC domain-containing protein [Candidatus Sericytochromatia bacterium]